MSKFFINGLVVALLCCGSASAMRSDVTPHRGARQADPMIYKKELLRASKRWKLDIYLLMGLIQTESRFDAGATSRTGAAGLGQFTTIGCKEVQRLAKISRYSSAFTKSANPRDAKTLEGLKSFDKKSAYKAKLNLAAAAMYLHHLLRHYKQNVEAALTHYNAGGKMAKIVVKHGFKEAKAKKLLGFSQAKSYAPHVLEWRAKFKKGWTPKKRR
jgi:soluble lytic murein transglycosylase-like protein